VNATILFLTLAIPQNTDAARRAIEIVRKAEGKVVFDEKSPSRPVIAINL
jgi:hypothetical protein